MPPMTAHSPRHSLTSPTTNERTTSSAWSPSEDDILMGARAQGQNWAPIARNHFPTKSANACRKRHERLMEKRNNAENWDGVKIEVLAREYLEIREQMWQLLADKVGEKWSTVEEKCMEKGLKTLLTAGRAAPKRQPSHQSEDPIPDNDDSGLGPEPPRDSSEPERPQSQPPAPTGSPENTPHLRSLSGNSYNFPPSSRGAYQAGHSARSSHHADPLHDSAYWSQPSSSCGPNFNIASTLPSTTTSLPSFASLPSSPPLPVFSMPTTTSPQTVPTSRSSFEMPSIADILHTHHGGSVSTY